MFKNLFGPFPDEPILYTVDKILGVFHKFDSKFKRNSNASNNVSNIVANSASNSVSNDASNNPTNKTEFVDTTTKKVIDVIDNLTTENIATSTPRNHIPLEKWGASSHTSNKKFNSEDNKKLVSIKVSGVIEKRENKSTQQSIVKKSSSMECNYTLSKMNVAKTSLNSGRKVCTKKVDTVKSSTKRYKASEKSKGFGDVVEFSENHFEKQSFTADGKKRIESILKQQTKHQKSITAPSGITELTSRKVIKTEWAITRVYTFDDDSQTYEVMKKDKVLERNGSIERIFAIAPNLTTVAFDPISHRRKRR